MQKNQTVSLSKASYQLLEPLASGGQGTIWKVKGQDNEYYALKVVNLYDTRFANPERHSNDYLQTLIQYANAEIDFLCSLDNTKVQHIAICIDNGFIEEEGIKLPAFIMPIYHRDDLKKRIKQFQEGSKSINGTLWLRWFQHLILALQSIQHDSTESKLVAHRDLKPANCLFDDEDNLYLSDFGIVRESSKTGLTSISRVGTFDFCAPEQCFARYEGIDGIPHFYITLKLDIYSAAMVMHEVIAGSTSAQQSLTETSINQHKQTLYGLKKPNKGKIGKLGVVGGLTDDERENLQRTLSDLFTPDSKKNLTIAFHQPSLPNCQLIATAATELIEQMLAPWPDDRLDVDEVLQKLHHIKKMLTPEITELALSQDNFEVVIGESLTLTFKLQGKGLPEILHWLVISLNQSPLKEPDITKLKNNFYQLTLPVFSELTEQTLSISALINGSHIKAEAIIDVIPDADYLWTTNKRLEALRLELRFSWLDQWEAEANTVSKKYSLLKTLKQLKQDYPKEEDALQQRYDRIDGRNSVLEPTTLPIKKIMAALIILGVGTTATMNWQTIKEIMGNNSQKIPQSHQIDSIVKLSETPKPILPDLSAIKHELIANNLRQRVDAWNKLNAIIKQHNNYQQAQRLKADYEQQTLQLNKKTAGIINRKEALLRLQVLASAGDGNAQYWLALRYLNGDGVIKDIKKGKAWVKKAADNGVKNAKQTLNYLTMSHNVSEQKSKKTKTFEPKMLPIPAGNFQMGCVSGKDCSNDEKPIHTVKIKAFELAATEVTFKQWDACISAKVCSYKPSDEGWGRGTRPVINVSWDDTQDYIKWLNKETGKQYRLPTEAEWEYASRAGTKTKYWWGNQAPSCSKQDKNGASFDGGETSDCYFKSQGELRGTEEATSYTANTWGLYNMHGNVWEWVQDKYENSYKNAPKDGSAQESKGALRVIRGGSWYSTPWFLRSALRYRLTPDNRINDLGFRLARSKDK